MPAPAPLATSSTPEPEPAPSQRATPSAPPSPDNVVFDAAGLRSLELAGSRFYLRDGLLELWLAVMVDALSDDAPPARWKWRLEDDLRDQATIVFEGLLVANIDSHITTRERLRAFTALCRQVRSELASGRFVAGPFAQRIGASRWNAAMPERLLRVTDAVLWLAANEPRSSSPHAQAPGDR